MAVFVRSNSLFILCHSLQNKVVKLPHSEYSSGRKLRGPSFVFVFFFSFDAVLQIQFGIDLTVIDKLNESTFLQDS